MINTNVDIHNLIVIREAYGNEYNAGPKAQRDVAQILISAGAQSISVKRNISCLKVGKLFFKFQFLIYLFFKTYAFPVGSTVLIQYPSSIVSGKIGLWFMQRLRRLRKIKIITLIHDITECRFTNYKRVDVVDSVSSRTIKLSDVVIVHNSKMREWIKTYVDNAPPMVDLELFDYLCNIYRSNRTDVNDYKCQDAIVIAGNLDPKKSGYISELRSVKGIKWHLYGVGLPDNYQKEDSIIYEGVCHPDELPGRLTGKFGLVWDGCSVVSCKGPLGEYLRLNNPHKLSLYVAASMPIIIWAEAAEAEFVKKYSIGLSVDSLQDLSQAFGKLTEDVYNTFRRNVSLMSTLVKKGYFTLEAVNKSLRICKDKRSS